MRTKEWAVLLALALTNCGGEPEPPSAQPQSLMDTSKLHRAPPVSSLGVSATATDICQLEVDWEESEPRLRFTDPLGCLLAPPVVPCPECPPPSEPPPSEPPPTTPPPSSPPPSSPPPSTPPPSVPPLPDRGVAAYYLLYYWNQHPPATTVKEAVSAVDVKAMTDLLIAYYYPGTGADCGSLLEGGGSGHSMGVEDALITKAHAAGTKAILMLGGFSRGPGFDCSTSTPTVRAKFVAEVAAKVAAKDYDGVDLDWEEAWETPAQKQQMLDLLRDMRAAMPGKTLSWTWFWSLNPGTEGWVSQMAAAADSVNIMSYAMAGNWGGWDSWHGAALSGDAPSHPSSVTKSVGQYVAAGVPKAKLRVGLGLYGVYNSQCGVTGPGQSLVGDNCVVQADDNENMYSKLVKEGATARGTLKWDAAAKQSYVTYSPPWQRYPQTPGTLLDVLYFEDTAGITEKGKYVDAEGLGGFMVWAVNYGSVSLSSNPLMDAVKSWLTGTPPSPPPSTPPPTTPPPTTPPPTSPPATPPPTPIPPNPAGYVGYGAITKGGEGGDVFIVTNLKDSGASSLRNGVTNRAGPRVVKFTPGLTGTIKLATVIKLQMPYLTIDGSMADITIEQPNMSTPAIKIVATHDIIIDSIRSAGLWNPLGPGGGLNDAGTLSVDGDGGALSVPWDPNPTVCVPTEPTYKRNSCRIVINRVTLSGAADDGPDFWCGVSDLTISRSLIIDSFHPRGTGCKGVYAESHHHARRRITEFANVYAFNGERAPKLGEGVYDYDFVNAVVYAWQDYDAGNGPMGYGALWETDGAQHRHNIVSSVFMPEIGGKQGAICAVNPGKGLGGDRCREPWDCVWGFNANDNNEVNLEADWLFYEDNVFGPRHNKSECVTTKTGTPLAPRKRVPRPYTLPEVKTSDLAGMEKILDAAGVQQRTPREQEVVDKVRAMLRAKLGN